MKVTLFFVIAFASCLTTEVASILDIWANVDSVQTNIVISTLTISSRCALITVMQSNRNLNENVTSSSCEGYLIASNIVISTAQCLDGNVTAVEVNIKFGSGIVGADSYVKHQNYNSVTLENDISLIKLIAAPISYGALSQLPTLSMRSINYVGKFMTAVGLTSSDSLISQIKIGSPQSNCSIGNFTNFICVSGNRIFKFNTGSALFHGDKLVGIFSQSKEGNISDVYTRVDRYLEWITAVTQVFSNYNTIA